MPPPLQRQQQRQQPAEVHLRQQRNRRAEQRIDNAHDNVRPLDAHRDDKRLFRLFLLENRPAPPAARDRQRRIHQRQQDFADAHVQHPVNAPVCQIQQRQVRRQRDAGQQRGQGRYPVQGSDHRGGRS